MNDLVVQFARLWGQREAWCYNLKDEEVADMLKAYDSEELQQLLQTWVDEYLTDENAEDSVDFFEKKIGEMYEKEEENKFHEYVLEECKRQWHENQEEIYGPWEEQLEEEQADYFHQMANHLAYNLEK